MMNLADKILARKGGMPRAPKMSEGTKPKLTFGRAMKYAFVPDFGSRVRDIGKRLGGFAYFLAQIFYSCRLIPAGHPTLQTANIGYFGFSDVISTAASNLHMRRENIDQIVMFGAVILSMVLLVANGLAIAAFTVLDFGTAFAQTAAAPVAAGVTGAAASGSMFAAPNPETDLALIFLDRVFGTTSVPFFSVTEPGASNSDLGKNPIKEALYHMLGLYSTAMMVVAVVIILYYAFTIVGESAQTGQPFGKRFNSFWAPIRLVVGLGLLVPIAGGLNAAQYITLYAAKMGSGFASYAWSGFVDELGKSDLIAPPTKPMVTGLVTSIVRFEACRAYIQQVENMPVNVEIDNKTDGNFITKGAAAVAEKTLGKTFGRGLGFVIGWDKQLGTFSGENEGGCGEIYIDNLTERVSQTNDIEGDSKSDAKYRATKALVPEIPNEMRDAMISGYLKMVEDVIKEVRDPVTEFIAQAEPTNKGPNETGDLSPAEAKLKAAVEKAVENAAAANQKIVTNFTQEFDAKMADDVKGNINQLDKYGWMGAGMFFNQIADLNGSLVNQINNSFPRVTQDIQSGGIGSMSGDGVNLAGVGTEADSGLRLRIEQVEKVVGESYNPEVATRTEGKKGIVYLIVSYLFGGSNLAEFQQQAPTNPMALLVAMGKGFIDKASILITIALSSKMLVATGILGKVLGGLGGGIAGLATTGPLGAIAGTIGGAIASSVLVDIIAAIAGFLVTIAFIGLMFGLLLYYVVPLFPFIYALFSIFNWVLEIIEAMVGLPLWALAHIRIDGDGLSGQAAQNGYMLIFGIMLRPFVTIFALIATILLFSAGMMMIHEMYFFAASSIGDGQDTGFDFMVFAAVYVMISYSFAKLCFKQIDQMPKNFMRWFGSSASSYNDGQEDPVGFSQQTTLGAAVLANQVSQGVTGGGKEVMQGVQQRKTEDASRLQSASRDKAKGFDKGQISSIYGAPVADKLFGNQDSGSGPDGAGPTGGGGAAPAGGGGTSGPPLDGLPGGGPSAPSGRQRQAQRNADRQSGADAWRKRNPKS